MKSSAPRTGQEQVSRGVACQGWPNVPRPPLPDSPAAAYGAIDASAADPKVAYQIHNNQGAALMQLGRAAEAVPLFQAALGLQPDNADAHHNLATAFKATGMLTEAVAQYEMCLARSPEMCVCCGRGGASAVVHLSPDAVPRYSALCGKAESLAALAQYVCVCVWRGDGRRGGG